MTNRFSALSNLSTSFLIWTKRGLALTLIAASFSAQAAPANMGIFTTTKVGIVNDKWQAEGRYTAASGATGSTSWGGFTITREEMIGYENNVSVIPSSGTRNNGIEIRNQENTSVAGDKFKYTFTITPDERTSIHTIKIGQASYTTTGNSEIARQTLNFTKNDQISVFAEATVKNNPEVGYYYEAMGDYFMGSAVDETQLSSQRSSSNKDTISGEQLRVDDSNKTNSGLYYYNISRLNGVTGVPYKPDLNTSNEVTAAITTSSVLPPTPTFKNIFKSTNPNNKDNYKALGIDTGILNNGSYVSYGIENSVSNYVVAVRNAKSVTLTYEGIMNGNIGIPGGVIGETYSEWISFGVESEPVNYVFSGYVFNDNGAIPNINNNESNNNYFNGKFDSLKNTNTPTSTPPYESGIKGSTVKLINCETKAVLKDNVQTDNNGKYEIIIPTTPVANRSKVCLTEERMGDSYPIRTTTSEKSIDLGSDSNKYQYDNNNFGRVIKENAALVLKKEQAINDCKIDSLLPTPKNKLTYSKDALSNVTPGQCIAYKITATNRSNLAITNFVMQDTLQNKGSDNTKVTSVLANPTDGSSDYASDSVGLGNNGTVKTNILTLDPRLGLRPIRIFYFNTKYGTTQSN